MVFAGPDASRPAGFSLSMRVLRSKSEFMTIAIYNSLTRQTQPLAPLEPDHVRMYVCGVTVYDLCHIGHGRTFVAFDVIRRWLLARGFRVSFVRNITDIDDKIIRRAAECGVSIDTLTQGNIAAMREDLAALGCLPPDEEPCATQFVPQMLQLIDRLAEKDLAYQAADGDVNFAVRKFPHYGKLSGRSLDELRAGERVAVDTAKRDPLDFVLWKAAKVDEPAWDSKWGKGRPGWHIECSAMAHALLGQPFDIHGGGPDLLFPHHENEIAQSEGAHDVCFAKVWMHTGALRVGDEKMSKSLGNFWTIRDALKQFDGEVLRFFLLRAHYRTQVAFDREQVEQARAALTRLYTALLGVAPDQAPVDWHEQYAQRFAEAMDDDFNTALATAVLFELAGEVNRSRSAQMARQLKGLGATLGLLQQDPLVFVQGGESADVVSRIEVQIEARRAAKAGKDFALADQIRDALLAEGIVLEDKPTGTVWRRR